MNWVKYKKKKNGMTEKPAGDGTEYLPDLWKNNNFSFEAVEYIMKERTDRSEYIKNLKLLYNEKTARLK